MSDGVLDLMSEVTHLVQAGLRALPVLDEFGLSAFQAKALSLIGRKPGSTQQALAAALGSDKAQIARTIKELESRKLIVREAHQSDWRAQSLRLSGTGESVYAVLAAQRDAFGEDVLRDLAPDERECLHRAFAKIRNRLSL